MDGRIGGQCELYLHHQRQLTLSAGPISAFDDSVDPAADVFQQPRRQHPGPQLYLCFRSGTGKFGPCELKFHSRDGDV